MKHTRWLILLILVAAVIAQKKPPTQPDNTGNMTLQSLAINTEPQPHIAIGGDMIIEVDDKNDKLMVKVTHDGKVTYGDGYKPDDGAKEFWETLAKYYPQVCKKLEVTK